MTGSGPVTLGTRCAHRGAGKGEGMLALTRERKEGPRKGGLRSNLNIRRCVSRWSRRALSPRGCASQVYF